jgi:hypothetical protein
MDAVAAKNTGFRPVGRFLSWLGPVWIAAIVSLIASIPLTLAALGVNYAATFMDRDSLRQHVNEAFASGQLEEIYYEPSEIDRGGHPYNDCLILHLSLRDDLNAWEHALAPRVSAVEPNPCAALKTLAETPEIALGQPASGYVRYMHGQSFFGGALISAMPLDAARVLLKIVTFAVLGSLLVFALFRCWRLNKDGKTAQATTAGFVAIAATMLLLFYDEAGFSVTLGHFIEDMVLFGYLWFALLVEPSRWTPRMNIAIHTVLGVLTAWMEFLTGGIPLCACAIALVFASQAAGPNANEQLRRFLVAGAAFAAAIVGAFAFKMFLTAQAVGPDVWADFGGNLQSRMVNSGQDAASGKAVGLINAWQEMAWYADRIGLGSRMLGRALIGASFLAVAYGVFVIVRRRMWGEKLVQPGLLIVGFMAIVLWHVAFYPHTSVHAVFMVRTLVGLFITAAALIVCLHGEQLGALLRRSGLRKKLASDA